MEYVYGAMLLHSAGKEVDEKSLESVLKAGGVKVDKARLKVLVSSLEGVDIDEAIKTQAPVAAVAPAAAPAAEEATEAKAEEKEKEEEKSEEEAAEGLASLFG
ncbi:MAG: 50S ribosomal protein P1 [Candidatus Altiarchaeales archaeon]|nr:50S ribosomal protein P1 [Candidatus Altiarchaeales archaeon]